MGGATQGRRFRIDDEGSHIGGFRVRHGLGLGSEKADKIGNEDRGFSGGGLIDDLSFLSVSKPADPFYIN
jgi:hypothetical protein